MNGFWFFKIKGKENPLTVNLNIQGFVNNSTRLLISFIITFIVLLSNEQPFFRPYETGRRGVFMATLQGLPAERRIETGGR
jgi:hypothetical protein